MRIFIRTSSRVLKKISVGDGEVTEYGYVRVSTLKQDLGVKVQLDAMEKLNIKNKNIVIDKISGTKDDRPNLAKLIKKMKKGDVLYIYKLDRLTRRVKKMTELVELFNKRGIEMVSLTQPINIKSAEGRCQCYIFTAIAELEVENLRARTRAGLNKSTKKGGRKSIPDKVIKEAVKLNLLGEMTNIEIANELEISVTTLYRYLRKERSFCKVSD